MKKIFALLSGKFNFFALTSSRLLMLIFPSLFPSLSRLRLLFSIDAHTSLSHIVQVGLSSTYFD